MEVNPYAPPQVSELAPLLTSLTGAEAVRRDHLKVEATIKSVGVLYYLGSFFTLAGVVLIFFDDRPHEAQERLEILVGTVAFLVAGLVQGVLAYGLRRLRSWARWPTVVLSCISLLGFPLGTIISILILVNLLGSKAAKVFSPEYKQIIAMTPHMKYQTSMVTKILLVILILVLVGVGAAILFG